MSRHIGLIIIGLAAIASLNAGQVQIGQVIGGVNDGLTTNWVTNNGATNSNKGTEGFVNYDKILFWAGTQGAVSPTPFNGYSNTVGTASTVDNSTNGVLTDPTSSVVFDMISQSGNYGNFWAAQGATPSITIPIGVFGVTDAWTMLNNEFGVAGVNTTDVTFTFNTQADGSGTFSTVTVDLVDGKEIRSSVQCITNCSSNGGLPATYVTGLVASNTGVATGGNPLLSSMTINTNEFTGFPLSYDGGSAAPFTGTTGKLNLDDQDFQFGSAFSNYYLLSMTVTDTSGAVNVSRTALSAVTVVTGASADSSPSSAPEPSTVLMLLGGLGVLGIARLRRA
jgi:hypothetical protein